MRERESLNFDSREKKYWLIPIQTMRKVDIGVNEFHSMRRVAPKFYFSFSLPEMVGTRKVYFLRLILGFWITIWVI
jgi:hypothetical protein